MVVNQLRDGGTEILAADLAGGLAAHGVDCRLAALHASPGDGDTYDVATQVLGDRITMRAIPRACLRLRDLCHRDRPDLVHSHGEAPTLVGRLVCRQLGLPHVVTAHTLRPWHWRRRLGRVLERQTAPLTRQFAAVSEAVGHMLRDELGIPADRIRVIPNWVPRTREPDAVGPMPLPGQPTILHVARLDVAKGQDLLLDAFAQTRRVFPEAVLWIVGTGPEESRLRRLAGAGVTFLGYRADVPHLLRQADLFVLSSHWEGMPLSILEAMAAGLPVVATAVGGVPEIVHDGITGRLVPPDNPQALAEGLIACLRDPLRARKLAAAGQRQCQDLRQRGLAAYRDWYEQALRHRPEARRP